MPVHMQVIVPLGNNQVISEGLSNPSQSATDITKLINESKGHKANAAWGLTNELTGEGTGCGTSISQACLNLVVKACQLIQQHDSSKRPVVITHVDEPGFVTPKAVKNALQSAGMETFYNSRIVHSINFYFADQQPNIQAISFGGVIDKYFSDAELSQTPLIIGEYGS